MVQECEQESHRDEEELRDYNVSEFKIDEAVKKSNEDVQKIKNGKKINNYYKK